MCNKCWQPQCWRLQLLFVTGIMRRHCLQYQRIDRYIDCAFVCTAKHASKSCNCRKRFWAKLKVCCSCTCLVFPVKPRWHQLLVSNFKPHAYFLFISITIQHNLRIQCLILIWQFLPRISVVLSVHHTYQAYCQNSSFLWRSLLPNSYRVTPTRTTNTGKVWKLNSFSARLVTVINDPKTICSLLNHMDTVDLGWVLKVSWVIL